MKRVGSRDEQLSAKVKQKIAAEKVKMSMAKEGKNCFRTSLRELRIWYQREIEDLPKIFGDVRDSCGARNDLNYPDSDNEEIRTYEEMYGHVKHLSSFQDNDFRLNLDMELLLAEICSWFVDPRDDLRDRGWFSFSDDDMGILNKNDYFWLGDFICLNKHLLVKDFTTSATPHNTLTI